MYYALEGTTLEGSDITIRIRKGPCRERRSARKPRCWYSGHVRYRHSLPKAASPYP